METYELTNLRTYIKDFEEGGQRVGNVSQRIVYIKIYILFFDPDRVFFFA